MNFGQYLAEDQTLSRVGILFCCTVSLLVFVVAIRVLPISRSLPGQLQHSANLVNPASDSGKQLVGLTPAPSAAASAPSAAPTPMAPPAAASPISQPAAVPTTAPPAPTAAPRRSATAVPDKQTYTVQPGDTLYSIARRNGTTPQSLASANGLAADALVKVGERLHV